MAKGKAKTDEKATEKVVKAPVENVEPATADEAPVEAPVEEVVEEAAPTEEATEQVVEGNDNPVTGEAHDCMGEGRVRSISVGGRRMTECIVCGNRF